MIKKILSAFVVLGLIFSNPALGAFIQGHAPDGAATRALTAPSVIIEMKNTDGTARTSYSIITSDSGCVVRSMPTATSTKATYKTHKILPTGNRIVEYVNGATPFVNLSSCVGDITIQ